MDETFQKIGNPIKRMQRICELIAIIVDQIRELVNKNEQDKQQANTYLLTSPEFERIFKKKSEIENDELDFIKDSLIKESGAAQAKDARTSNVGVSSNQQIEVKNTCDGE